MTVKSLMKRNTYFDSVTLMQIGSTVKKEPGIRNAVVGMGTDFNIDSLKRLDLFVAELRDATPNDLLICVDAEDEARAAAGVALAEKLMTERKSAKTGEGDYAPPTLRGALERLPGANVVLVSLPGRFAAREVRTALEAGRHVMLFSDNVTVEEELDLKELAVEKGLLMMGPDCGTAIVNGVPLAFANKVRRGEIGVVAASGTGLQEVTALIHRFGCGITQAIGVGGRDLSEKIGGRMTLLAARALAADPATKVLLLVSKPPAAATLPALFSELQNVGKPVVVYFIGADPAAIRAAGFEPAENLEDAARRAVRRSSERDVPPLLSDDKLAARASKAKMTGPCVRALYSGGTLCDEAQRVLLPVLGEIRSNTPVKGALPLADIHRSEGHTIVDLGDDDFTRGRAHPMIDPAARVERIAAEFADPATGLLMLDVVLGYGSHPDMAGEMAAAVVAARAKTGKSPVVAATILGTDEDPQGYDGQKAKLEEAGIEVFPSNVLLCRYAALVAKGGVK